LPTGKQRSRASKFRKQLGVCYWYRQAILNGQKPKCPDPHGLMTLFKKGSGTVPANYATFEHLQRRRDGGLGKHCNIVLACKRCNNNRDAHLRLAPMKPENIAARALSDVELLEGARSGTLSPQACGQLFRRGLVPNWPMWFKLMRDVPLEGP
jgi:hypothetical protein